MTDPEAAELSTWYTPSEVGELLGVRVATVRKWIHAGKLAASRTPGGRYRVRADALDVVPGREAPAPVPGPGRRSAVFESIIERMIEERE